MAVDDRWHKHNPKTGKRDLPSTRYGRGKRWRVRNPGYREQLFERKTDAERVDASQRGQIVAGKLPWDPESGAVTYEAYATQVLQSRHKRGRITERSLNKMLGEQQRHVFPVFGHKHMNAIGARDIKDWMEWVQGQVSRKTKKPLSDGVIESIWVTIGSIFREAQTDRVKPEHPMVSVEPVKRAEQKPVRPWSEDTVRSVLSAMDERGRGPALMSAWLGMRPGESLAVSLGDIKGKRFTIRHGIVYGGAEHGAHLAPPKNKSERVVPLAPTLAATIQHHADTYGTVRMWCDCHQEWNDLVFHDAGAPWMPRRYEWRVWTPAVRAAGLLDARDDVDEQGRPNLRVVGDDETDDETASGDLRPGQHQLRHYYASKFIAKGVPPPTIQKRLGHKNLNTTIKIYHHLLRQYEDDDAAWLDGQVTELPLLGDGEPDTPPDPTGTGE